MNSKKIKKIRVVNESTLKYSVNVQDNHNYISTGDILSKNCIIVDEAQNVTFDQMEMIVTRIGLNSRMIICGDDAQVDLRYKNESGFRFLYNAANNINDAISIKLNQNHRHSIVDDLINAYEEHTKKQEVK